MTSPAVTGQPGSVLIDTPEEIDVNVYRGDTVRWSSVVTDINNIVIDLTNWTITGQVRRSADSAEVIATIYGSSISPTTGVAFMTILPVDTLVLGTKMVGQGSVPAVYDVQIVSNDTTPVVFTICRGSVTFEEDVTHA